MSRPSRGHCSFAIIDSTVESPHCSLIVQSEGSSPRKARNTRTFRSEINKEYSRGHSNSPPNRRGAPNAGPLSVVFSVPPVPSAVQCFLALVSQRKREAWRLPQDSTIFPSLSFGACSRSALRCAGGFRVKREAHRALRR